MRKCIKNILVPVVLFATTCAPLLAQKVKMGLKIEPGMGWTKVEGPNCKSNGFKPTMSYGLLADFALSERYFFASEFSVSYLGAKVKIPTGHKTGSIPGSTAITNTTFDYQLQYLEIPLSFKFRTKEIGRIAYWAQFGIVNGFLIRALADIDSDGAQVQSSKLKVNQNPAPLKEFTDDVSAYRMGMIIGGGIELPVNNETRLFAGLRLNNGITDLSGDNAITLTNSALSLQMGIYF